MNTGIGDAVNLGWKLAEVIAGRAPARLLDSYELERIAFARKLVATTDRAFRGMVDTGRAGRFLRTWLAPRALPRLLRFADVRRRMFAVISQIQVSYRDQAGVEGRAGEVRGGDRLPWVAEGGGNFAPLRSLAWQAHVYGRATEALRAAAGELGLALVEATWRPAAERAGLAKDGLYLVRPDGHVALAEAEQDVGVLRRYVGEAGLKFA